MSNISSVMFRDMTFFKKKAICSSQMLLVVMDCSFEISKYGSGENGYMVFGAKTFWNKQKAVLLMKMLYWVSWQFIYCFLDPVSPRECQNHMVLLSPTIFAVKSLI